MTLNSDLTAQGIISQDTSIYTYKGFAKKDVPKYTKFWYILLRIAIYDKNDVKNLTKLVHFDSYFAFSIYQATIHS